MGAIRSLPIRIVISNPPTTVGSLYVQNYNPDEGDAAPNSPLPMFWQSNFVTKDGTLIEFGAGDHQLTSDNGIREYNPITKTQSYVYPNNGGTKDNQQYDNLHYFYTQRLDSLVFANAQFYRGTNKWLLGSLISSTRKVIGTGDNDLFRPMGTIDVNDFMGTYNAHQAWSQQYDCGVCISGGIGGDSVARPRMWLKIPSSGIGNYPQPYIIYQRDITMSGGVNPNKVSGRDGCCFAGEYVYWVGGYESLGTVGTPHFFRMKITPLLTNMNAPLNIERLADAPAGFVFGLLRYDPTLQALLCISDKGIFAFDIPAGTWSDVTPTAFRAEFNQGPMKGLLPQGCMGDFITSCQGQILNKFFFRPGFNGGWEYDYGGAFSHIMYRGFRSIKLARR